MQEQMMAPGDIKGEELRQHQECIASAESLLQAIAETYQSDTEQGANIERYVNIIGIAAAEIIMLLRKEGDKEAASSVARGFKAHINNGMNAVLPKDTIN